MDPYNKINWLDHIVDPTTEEVIQEGTPLSQANLNNMDNGIAALSEAFISFTTQAAEQLAQLEGTVTEALGRIGQLEDMIFNDITGNPWSVSFTSLDGLEVTGVWNQALARLEF